jgi:hypothetical protein
MNYNNCSVVEARRQQLAVNHTPSAEEGNYSAFESEYESIPVDPKDLPF